MLIHRFTLSLSISSTDQAKLIKHFTLHRNHCISSPIFTTAQRATTIHNFSDRVLWEHQLFTISLLFYYVGFYTL
ncbi:hypothetical protein RchiOBHm_Chr6g0256261 [Rosa chinensis]|uniref:Uncharacterized protein n=1 Tax=Rosa chinensis TaxID=74649 RepID=A0A2P6PM31_ROSCH|nr:hypothetical protein RchiOBHm_Chr6g0256261 [Rosa chinensis]